jgi:hypothetical protein
MIITDLHRRIATPMISCQRAWRPKKISESTMSVWLCWSSEKRCCRKAMDDSDGPWPQGANIGATTVQDFAMIHYATATEIWLFSYHAAKRLETSLESNFHKELFDNTRFGSTNKKDRDSPHDKSKEFQQRCSVASQIDSTIGRQDIGIYRLARGLTRKNIIHPMQ